MFLFVFQIFSFFTSISNRTFCFIVMHAWCNVWVINLRDYSLLDVCACVLRGTVYMSNSDVKIFTDFNVEAYEEILGRDYLIILHK